MPAPIPMQRVSFEKNFGGASDAGDNTDLAPHQALRALNIRLSPSGAFGPRRGYQVLNTASVVASGPIIGVFQYQRFSGTDDTILVVGSGTVSGTQIVRLNTGTNTFVSLQPSAGVVRAEPTFAVTNDRLIIGLNTSTQEAITWDGSATAFTGLNSASAPIGAAWADFKNHAVVMGVFARPGGWEFSHLGNPTAYRNSDRVDVDRPTVGGTSIFGTFLVFSNDRIVRIEGSHRDDFEQAPLRGNTGARTPRAIVGVENRGVIVWHGHDGHFYESNGIEITRVSNRIENWIQGDSAYFNLDTTQAGLESVYGVNYITDRRAGFLVRESGDSQNFFVLWYWYDLRTMDEKAGKPVGAWTLDEYDRAFASLGKAVENGTEVIYAGDTDGHLCRLEQGNSDGFATSTAVGSAITARYRKGPFYGETYELAKRWRETQMVSTCSATMTFTINLRNDYSDTVAESATIDEIASGVPLRLRAKIGQRSNALDLEFVSTSTNPAWEVQRFSVLYQTLPGRRS